MSGSKWKNISFILKRTNPLVFTKKQFDMKKFLFLVIGVLSFCFMDSIAQINRFSKPVPANFESTYVPLSSEQISAIKSALDRRQALHDNNKKHIDNLIDWLFELRNKDTDELFQNQMKVHYKKLRAFDGKDLSVETEKIRTIELGIKENILDYNFRVKEKNKKQPKEMLPVGSKVFLFSLKGLHKFADIESEVIIEVKGKVELISICNDGYYKTKYEGKIGYIHYTYIYKI